MQANLDALDTELNGNVAKNQIGEKSKPTIGGRLFALNIGISNSTYGPTATHKKTMELISTQQQAMNKKLMMLKSEIKEISALIVKAGGPWIEGVE